jgi:hypothetical protein
MKKFLICLFIISACSNNKTKPIVAEKDTVVYYPYAPVYSTEFEKGKSEFARNVLRVWRQYENGNVLNERASFADSIRLILWDDILTGKRDSVLTLLKKRRDNYSDMQCFVNSWMPVHVKDEDDDVVFVWGLQDGTKNNGDRDYSMIHEVWRLDKKGKIKELEQYRTHPH